jgi:hypothetical protein
LPKWNLEKKEHKNYDGETETVTYEATVTLEGDDPEDQLTLAELGALIGNLTTVDGIPSTAKLGTTITAPLRWTDADL